MKNNRNIIQAIVVIMNSLGILFYYSQVSLYGYWSDTFFLLLTIIVTFLLLKQVKLKLLQSVLKTLCIFNLIVIFFVSFSFFYGIVPVHFIPKGHLEDKNTYGYFIERGNFGLIDGCYGEVQIHKQISWLPFLEFKIETNECSSMDYNSIINGD